MAKLYDNRIGTGVLVADERVDELVQTGNYSFIKGPEIHLTDDAGALYSVPPENAKAAIESGYFYAPAHVVQDNKLREKIEDSPLTSAGYGLLRGASFGISDAFGPERELQLRREIQPGYTAAGEITSLLTPYGLTSLLARGASSLAVRGASKAATALFKSGIKATQTADKAKRVGSGINSRVVRGVIGGVAEGAVVGSMYGLSGQLLDDPENYPTFTDHIFAGAGFGGAAGGVVGAIAGALSGVGGAFKKMRDRAYWRALDPKAKDWRDVTKKGKNIDADTELGAIMAKLDSKDPSTGNRIMENLDDAKELINEIDNTLLSKYGQKIDDIILTVTQAIKKSGQSVDDIQLNIDATARRMMDEIAEPMRGGLQLQAYKAQYRKAVLAIDEFKRLSREKSGGKDTLTFQQAEAVKRIFGKGAYKNKATPEAQREFMQQMTAIIQKGSEEALEGISGKLSRIDGFPHATYAEFLDAKLVFGALHKIRALAEGAAQRESTNARIPLTSYITGAGIGGGIATTADSVLGGGALGVATFAGTALLRKYAKDSGELLLARSMNRITDYGGMLNSANVSQTAIKTAVSALVRGGSATTIKIANPFPDNDAQTVKRFKKLKKDVELLKTNPQTLYVRLNEMLPEVEGSQVINQEMAQTLANIVGFLSEKMPANNSTSQLMYNDDQTPPMNLILKFMRYVDVLNDPNKILQYVAGGKLMPEHMEAIKTIFPRLHQEQKEAVLNGLTEQGLPLKLDLSQRQSLGRFLGTATEPIFSKGFTERTQGAYAKAKEQAANQKGMNIKLPNYNTAIADVAALG